MYFTISDHFQLPTICSGPTRNGRQYWASKSLDHESGGKFVLYRTICSLSRRTGQPESNLVEPLWKDKVLAFFWANSGHHNHKIGGNLPRRSPQSYPNVLEHYTNNVSRLVKHRRMIKSNLLDDMNYDRGLRRS